MSDTDDYVVDASVGVKWVVDEPGSDRARFLLHRLEREEVELFAPDVYVAEVSNVVWKVCRLRGQLSAELAHASLRQLLAHLPELIPTEILAEQALELAMQFRRSVYDCLYAALAVRLGCTLVTADRSLVNALGPAMGRVIHLDDLAVGA